MSVQGGSVERAADWVFSHADELDSVDQGHAEVESQEKYHDGLGSKSINIDLLYHCLLSHRVPAGGIH